MPTPPTSATLPTSGNPAAAPRPAGQTSGSFPVASSTSPRPTQAAGGTQPVFVAPPSASGAAPASGAGKPGTVPPQSPPKPASPAPAAPSAAKPTPLPPPTLSPAQAGKPSAAPTKPGMSAPTPVPGMVKPGTPTVQVMQNGTVVPRTNAAPAPTGVTAVNPGSPVGGVKPAALPGTPVAVVPPASAALGVRPAAPVTPVGTPVARPAGSLPASPAARPLVPPAAPVASTGKPVSLAPVASAKPAVPPAQPPVMAKPEVKKPPFWLFAIIGVVLLAVVGVWLFSMFTGGGSPTSSTRSPAAGGTAAPAKPVKQTTIVYWGLWEPTEVMQTLIQEFEAAHPEYKIDYRKQSHKDYRERLQTAIASGNGPDIFRFHASWVPMLQQELAALPSTVMSPADFQQTFYPVAVEQLTANNKIFGLPLMYDGLALYYNKEMLKAANAEPPQTWAELKALADSLTVPSNKAERGRGTLQRAGLAIGNATNVEHFADIFALLVLQNGGDLSQPNSTEVRDALLFYTNFVKEDKVWSDAMPSSTVAFARGDVAMMFAPSWRALDIKAMNPNLDFAVAPLPQLGSERVAWASYWAEGVNAKSKNQTGAWLFLDFLAQPENLEKFFSSASQVRPFGELYPRQDMAAGLSTDPILGAFLSDAPVATSWYLNSFTHDNGLNDQLIKYYGDAINATLDGKTTEEALETLDAGVSQVLRQYQAE